MSEENKQSEPIQSTDNTTQSSETTSQPIKERIFIVSQLAEFKNSIGNDLTTLQSDQLEKSE